MTEAHTIRCLAENAREQFLLQTLLDAYLARPRSRWRLIEAGRADVVIVATENLTGTFEHYAESLASTVIYYTSDTSLTRSKEFVLRKPATAWDLSCLLERLDAFLVAEKRLAEAFVCQNAFEPITVSSSISLRAILSC